MNVEIVRKKRKRNDDRVIERENDLYTSQKQLLSYARVLFDASVAAF